MDVVSFVVAFNAAVVYLLAKLADQLNLFVMTVHAKTLLDQFVVVPNAL